jgi:hypothetical protein
MMGAGIALCLGHGGDRGGADRPQIRRPPIGQGLHRRLLDKGIKRGKATEEKEAQALGRSPRPPITPRSPAAT